MFIDSLSLKNLELIFTFEIINYTPIITTIVGVVMGLGSSELSNWRRDKKAKRRKINSTRTLISLENERNLELLKEFWYKLNKSEEDEVSEDESPIDIVHRLIKMPMPCWDDFMWKKQASLLTITFKDKEIVAISSFNNSLESLKSIYSKLVDLDAKDREFNSAYASRGAEMSSLPHSNRFKEEAPGLWDEFEEITSCLIKNGNPLDKKKS